MYRFFTNLTSELDNFMPGGPHKRFLLTFIVFIVWIGLIDKNRWITQWQLQKTIYKYEMEKARLQEQITRTQEMTSDFQSDKEKFARESYLMTKSDEDLFIIAAE